MGLICRFRPQELGLTVWVNLVEATTPPTNHRVVALNSTVSIVEQPSSLFEPQLLFLYLLILTGLLGGGYWAYQEFYVKPNAKKSGRVKRKAVVPAPQSEKKYPDVKPYQEEWIPAEHLKNRGSKLKKTDGGETSGGEATSGGEMSGAEGKARRRKGKKA